MSASSSLAVSTFPVDKSSRRNPDQFNAMGMPRISEKQHLLTALKQSSPHDYIARQAGCMKVIFEGREQDGMGFNDAIDAHILLIDFERSSSPLKRDRDISAALANYQPDEAKIREALFIGNSLHSALQKIGRQNLPEEYQKALEHSACTASVAELDADDHRFFGR